jgi:hypothetical protein
MSAYGPKRTFLVALHMSAFGGKADIPKIWTSRELKNEKAPARKQPRLCLVAQNYQTGFTSGLPFSTM